MNKEDEIISKDEYMKKVLDLNIKNINQQIDEVLIKPSNKTNEKEFDRLCRILAFMESSHRHFEVPNPRQEAEGY